MKKAFIAVGLAFVCVVAFADWANFEHKQKEKREQIIAGTYK
jgi:hypothetical protein